MAKLNTKSENVVNPFESGIDASSTIAPFLGGRRNNHASQGTNASGFLLVPTEMQGKPVDPVERVHFMHCSQLSDSLLVAVCLLRGSHVVTGSAKPQATHILRAPAWVDLFQGG